jgi:hypothetical protein
LQAWSAHPFEKAGDENIVMLDESLPLPVPFMSIVLICLLSGYRTVEPAPFELTSLAGCPDAEEFSRFLRFIRDILPSGEVRIDSGFFPTEQVQRLYTLF